MIMAALDAGNSSLLGCWRRGLRRRPDPARNPGRAWHRIRARDCQQPPGTHRERHLAGRCPGRRASRAILANVCPPVPARTVNGCIPGRGSRSPPLPGIPGYCCAATTPPSEIAYYRTFSTHPVPLRTLVRVAGQRWRVEECFQTSKGLAGLDQHQVRRWTSWHRWVTLAMFAHAFLTVITAAERSARPTPDGLIPITVNELRKLFDALLLRPQHTPQRLQQWSLWRRRHQARSRACHYQKREQSP